MGASQGGIRKVALLSSRFPSSVFQESSPPSSLGWGPPLDPHEASAKERVIFLSSLSLLLHYISGLRTGHLPSWKRWKKRPEAANLASSVLLRPGSLFSPLTGCAKHGRWMRVAGQGRKWLCISVFLLVAFGNLDSAGSLNRSFQSSALRSILDKCLSNLLQASSDKASLELQAAPSFAMNNLQDPSSPDQVSRAGPEFRPPPPSVGQFG